MPASKYTDTVLRDAVSKSTSVMQVLDNLGLKRTGGSHVHISRLIRDYGIDISHFRGQASNKGKKFAYRDPEKILVEGKWGDVRVRGSILLECLIAVGVPFVCSENCGVASEWNGKPIRLQVDHRDGCYWNNNIENLRFLCPNCHSQTENFGKIKSPARYCHCGNIKDVRSKQCADCVKDAQLVNHAHVAELVDAPV